MSDLDEVDWAELHQVIRQLEQAVKEAFGTDVCNWECLMNNAVKAGQSTHVHWHLYPRYLGGATFAGEEFPDPKWPRHLEDAVHMVSDETFREIMQALRSRLAGD
ncbi:HIT domain-containing protein [Candidatus Saccharibacteria bacterium oral taxon 488]|nr:HIT domain-containing protein [Candidatus Saccharibacteria bacterium oral taxon 488]